MNINRKISILLGYFKNDDNDCLSCQEEYYQECGRCDKIDCRECLVNPNFKLPDCISEACPEY